MVDLKSLEIELNQARQARIDAEAAISDVEAMVWEVQHPPPNRPRMMFLIDGYDPAAGHTVN
jgi:hypothetical protein